MSEEHVQHRDDNSGGLEPQEAGEAPEAIQPASDETVAAEGTSEAGAAPEDGASNDATPDDATPDDATPDDATPEDATPEDATPEDATPEDATPEEGAPKPKRRKKAEKAKPALKPPPPDRLEGAIEALLLVAGDVVRLERLRDLLGLASVLPLRDALDAIRERWDAAGLAFELEQVGGGVRVVTRPEYAEYVSRLGRRPASDKLSRALLETLCIVAYKQPVGRAEVERIRGVQAGEGLRQLLERTLLKVVGRSDQPGRPLLYGTTQKFLTSFGLDDLKDLPAPADLKRM